MTPVQAARWAATRVKGRGRFVWTRGVLVWAVAAGVWWPLVMAALFGRGFLLSMPFMLAIGVGGGYLFGAWAWRANERLYAEHVRDQMRRGRRRYDEYDD